MTDISPLPPPPPSYEDALSGEFPAIPESYPLLDTAQGTAGYSLSNTGSGYPSQPQVTNVNQFQGFTGYPQGSTEYPPQGYTGYPADGTVGYPPPATEGYGASSQVDGPHAEKQKEAVASPANIDTAFGTADLPKVEFLTETEQDKEMFKEDPVEMICPLCNATMATKVDHEGNLCTCLMCTALCCMGLIFGCCLIPFHINYCQDTIHICPNCEKTIGRYSCWRRLCGSEENVEPQ